jgi:hypothetical protein
VEDRLHLRLQVHLDDRLRDSVCAKQARVTRPLCSTRITGLPRYYRAVRPCTSLRYSAPCGFCRLGISLSGPPGHSSGPAQCRGCRFPRSAREPESGSRRLNAGRRLGSAQVHPRLMPSPLRRSGSGRLQNPRPRLRPSPNLTGLGPLGPSRGCLSARQRSRHATACNFASPRFDARLSPNAGGWLPSSSGGLLGRDSHPLVDRPFTGHTQVWQLPWAS